MDTISKVRRLIEAKDPSEEGEKDFLDIAKQVMTMMPDLPEDPKDAATAAAETFRKLSKSKALLQRAASFISKGGKSKQILRKAMRGQ